MNEIFLEIINRLETFNAEAIEDTNVFTTPAIVDSLSSATSDRTILPKLVSVKDPLGFWKASVQCKEMLQDFMIEVICFDFKEAYAFSLSNYH